MLYYQEKNSDSIIQRREDCDASEEINNKFKDEEILKFEAKELLNAERSDKNKNEEQSSSIQEEDKKENKLVDFKEYMPINGYIHKHL